ncbi:Leucine-rich repeat,Leucine-rich repeat domain, L domain-like [Cinara cedri]|uniref:Dynein axonemal light chain 1 n=1 Tax=Cinara cedri TaxID=506608 RepID=A0A5E4MFX4_9HEMI|nr:Leucine-rich repeat,Leucine-rich repeat domain, L domain-like [Cinara cedri]
MRENIMRWLDHVLNPEKLEAVRIEMKMDIGEKRWRRSLKKSGEGDKEVMATFTFKMSGRVTRNREDCEKKKDSFRFEDNQFVKTFVVKFNFLVDYFDFKGTTIKEAIARWEEKNQKPIIEATNVGFQFQWPPIEKIDTNLSILVNCEKLSLSTNMIEKITNIGTLRNLKILALGRNNIKSFDGLEPLADTLEELWISYNIIEKTKGILKMHNLKVLHMSNNMVKDWVEVVKLGEMQSLEDFLFVGNPLYDSMDDAVWRTECSKKLPKLKILDTIPIIRD